MTALYELQGITKEHTSGQLRLPALRGVDCTIKEAAVTALVGPSGSGKSTLLNILGMIERPTSGRVAFAGKDITDASEAALTEIRRSSLGFIFQNFNLIPVLSAVENVEYALYLEGGMRRAAMRQRALDVLERLGIAAQAKQRPSQLSGGQRQRVAIARALVKRPRVIFADEPTANLDSTTAAQIMAVINDLKRDWGTTVIVATHDQSIADAADATIRLRDGLISIAPRASKKERSAP